jgi:biopolymer transport protein ExbB
MLPRPRALRQILIPYLALVVSMFSVAFLADSTAFPQDDQGGAAAPAAPAPAPAAPAAAGNPAPKTENMLVKTWKSLGTMYAITFLIMSIVLVALVVRAIIAVQTNNFVPPDLLQGINTSLDEKNAQAAVELVQSDDSLLGVLVSAGLGKIQKGKEAVTEAMQVAGDSETMRLEQMLSYIALIGNIAPMVGLLGTVQGMVASFGTIASSPQTPKPNELANGIEQALYTTLVGLYLAIPAIAIYNILRNRVHRQIMTAGSESEEIIEKFQSLGK